MPMKNITLMVENNWQVYNIYKMTLIYIL